MYSLPPTLRHPGRRAGLRLLPAALPLAVCLLLAPAGAVRADDEEHGHEHGASAAVSFSGLLAAETIPALPVVPDPNEPIDADVMAKIRDEGMNRSQVMPILMYLTDVIGPRLTGSPGLKRANEWTRTKLTEWGLENGRLEPWGPFGRGWTLKRFSAQVVEPQAVPLIGFPKAWSPGVKGGKVEAEAVYLGDAADEKALEQYRGKLKGKVVLLAPIREVAARFEPLGARYSEDDLGKLATWTPPAGGAQAGGRRPGGPGGAPGGDDPAAAERFRQMQQQRRLATVRALFAKNEGAAVVFDAGRGDGGTVFVQQATVPQAPDTPAEQRLSPQDPKAEPLMVPQVSLGVEHYNRLARMIQAGEKVKVSVELAVESKVYDNGMSFNTVAEIPGADKKDEVVMCGGHIDSWQASTGATDNGAGVAVCMEAVRILKALGVKPRRTIRIALWSGEEQGLYGSRAYVEKHVGKLGEQRQVVPGPEHEKISAYFNLDNGTGKVRGVWAQSNPAVMPIFARWLEPFKDLGATTVTLRTTGGTDHLPFDGVGVPGFQFIQDEVEYDTRTHHSNQDSFDRIQAADMKQASVIMAAFLYNAAMREDKLPRKPLPAPRPAAE